jgi:mortality factor 4-like protein 1
MGYELNETVLAIDKGTVYKAKILKISTIGTKIKYFIHFLGWKSSFDVWVDESSMAHIGNQAELEKLYNSTSIVVVRKNQNNHKAQFITSDGEAHTETNGTRENRCDNNETLRQSSSIENKGTKRNRRSIESENTATNIDKVVITNTNKKIMNEDDIKKHRRQMIASDLSDLNDIDDGNESMTKNLVIPILLKKHLVDEWHLITQDPRHLLNLPKENTIAICIDEFLQTKYSKVNDEEYTCYKELFDGLRLYFDRALPTILLFRHEREQYDILLENEMRNNPNSIGCIPSSIYGVEHLLRLFVKLPKYMNGIIMPANEMKGVQLKLTEFLKFIAKNQKKYVDIAEYKIVDEAILNLRNHLSKMSLRKNSNRKDI